MTVTIEKEGGGLLHLRPRAGPQPQLPGGVARPPLRPRHPKRTAPRRARDEEQQLRTGLAGPGAESSARPVECGAGDFLTRCHHGCCAPGPRATHPGL